MKLFWKNKIKNKKENGRYKGSYNVSGNSTFLFENVDGFCHKFSFDFRDDEDNGEIEFIVSYKRHTNYFIYENTNEEILIIGDLNYIRKTISYYELYNFLTGVDLYVFDSLNVIYSKNNVSIY